jgi:uncharacterized protein
VNRRKWFQLVAGGAVSAAGSGLYATTVEPRWFDISHTAIQLPKLQHPVRVLHLSDLHSSAEVPTELLLHATRAGIDAKPDLICLTGDYVTTLRQYDAAGLAWVFQLLSQAAPTYAVVGNHDCGTARKSRNSSQEIRDLLECNGVNVLHNLSSTVELKSGAKLSLAGTADVWNTAEFKPGAAFEDVDEDLPVVALIHNPDAKALVGDMPWDLMLSGHTHGGQVMLPFVHPYWLPVTDARYIAGLYRLPEGRQLYITRGVGSSKGIRFRCRPEVSVLDLRPSPESV